MGNAAPALLEIRQGLPFRLGGRTIGIMAVVPNHDGNGFLAKASIMVNNAIQNHRNDYITRLWLRSGDVIPIEQSFYRVAGVAGHTGTAALPGGSRAAVVLDQSPQQLGDLALASAALPVVVEGSLELHGREIEVERIERRSVNNSSTVVAQIAIWNNDFEKSKEEKLGRINRVVMAAGESLLIGNRKHKILSVIESRPAIRLQGYVEIAAQPLPE